MALEKTAVSNNFWPIIMLLTGICISEGSVLFFNFQLKWDDQWVVINTYTDNGLTLSTIKAIFTEFYHGQYAPVNQIYYCILRSIFGYNPFYFHLAGLLVHFFNSCLVYFLIVKIITFSKILFKTDRRFSLFCALLFAIHPINLESTAWISASKVLLYAFFYLSAIYCYTIYLIRNKFYYYLLTVFLFILSFGAKEQAIVLPVCLLLLDYLFGRSILSRNVWIEKLPLFVLSSYFCWLTIQSQNIGSEDVFFYTYSVHERIILACYSLSEYLTKCLIPVKLSYLYPFPFNPGEYIPIWLSLCPLLLIVTLISFRDLFLNKRILFGVAFFLIHIFLVLNLVNPYRYAIIADRYAYLSSIGVCFLLGQCIWILLNSYRKLKLIGYFVVSVYLIFFIAYTRYHSFVWADSISLKQDFRNTIIKRNDYDSLKKSFFNNEE